MQVAGGGYDVAFENAATGLYSVWTTNSSGNYTGSLISGVKGNSLALESLETTFNQDLNGDGVIGVLIQKDGSTSLTQVGADYFLYGSGGTGPELQIGGAPFVAAQFGGWTPIGAVQVAGGGYDVAFENAASGLYTVWTTDGSGDYTGSLIGAVMGNSVALESLETAFNQDLNGDGVIGVLIQKDGSTSLTQVGADYFLYGSSGTGPELKIGGGAFVAAQFGGWTPIGAVQMAGGGYDVAFENAASGLYTAWTTDSSGNYTGSLIGAVTGNSVTLESLETTFNQDLNGDGVIGVLIQKDGSTSLTQVGADYFLYGSSGAGPELKIGGGAFVAAQFGGWTPIGAVQVAGGGYDVAFKNAATGLYTAWTTDNSGNYTGSLIGAVMGNSATLGSLETTFNQDLNGDGVIGVLIQKDGSTSLTQVGSDYFLYGMASGYGSGASNRRRSGIAAQFGGWTLIGAVQVAGGGYDVAFEKCGRRPLYGLDHRQQRQLHRSLIGAVAGNSIALESLRNGLQSRP